MKIIILPNKKICKYGKVLKFTKLNEESLCDFLIKNNVNINNNCGGFGKCSSCSIFINEGFSFFELKLLKFNYVLSCQLYNISSNLIISVFL
ncbi:2Fe-2S iron-sulfur cluster-binding protein [Candidatus Nasuia deltocephalinicola]|uniref:2Fe-2S iron-sulfur cluster-binding protein n=1 Tax=Candidatus Nasuia deltocephalincola TaxID=1160784 RepID=UPI00216B0E56|nr:2Fe-2S iron-sulfur cluster-binding protein [Candidatus Nasuia deltocephalinicola]